MLPQHDCPELNLQALLQSAGAPFTIVQHRQGAVIYAQGDASDSLIYIESGRVRLAVGTSLGREAISGLLDAGAFLGEEVLAGHAVRRHTAIAVTATEVLAVGKTPMIGLLHTHPAIADRFLMHIVQRHAHLEADLADQILNPCETRLARTLVELAGCDLGHPCRCTLPHVSQEIIAEMVGTSRSRVNVLMGKFKRLGLIEERGGELQIAPPLLHVVSDGNRDVSTRTRSRSSGLAV